MKRHSIAAALAVVALLSLPLPAATETAKPDISTDKSETYRQLDLFGTVFERVRADYVEEVSDEKLIEAAINGMLSHLDPHSSYLDAKAYRDMQVQTRGEFGGLGIEVTMENGLVKVVSPIDDTPAARAGVKPGDFITHIDGTPVLGLSLADAVEKMRGKVGTKIKITVRRPNSEPLELTLTRDVIKIQSVRSRIEGDIGYIRVTSFNERADVGVKQALEQFKQQLGKRWKGVVLDLRNNPGGLLEQAVSISDIFLDKGEIVSTRGRNPESAQRWNAKKGDLADGLPMIVLINGGSASASEIVAGALQDHRRAIILGTRSFGKGSVQTIIPLAGHGAMRLTTARYYTPSGASIQAKGIEPDIVVEQAKIETIASPSGRREADLPGALTNPNAPKPDATKPEDKKPDAKSGGGAGGATPSTNETGEGEEKPTATAEDYQLSRALDLLRGLALFNQRTVN
ncbi:MAG TPA: S41 family peptidase [Alphaproteobacteria bacterium]|jgi:carboxyl-terminal processing protease|nr:S41 family peptidase [Alphaproteobacteria bacterium]